MNPELARELREAGLSADEAAELAEVARKVERLPEAAPRKAWLLESKWRLLRRFDELKEERARGEAEEPPAK